MKKPLIVIAGPTASGKSSLSVELAKKINGEIISADSMQVYKGMDIGTAKITKQEMDGIIHHLIDVLEPDEPFNVNIFQKLAREAIEEIYSKGKIPIIAGGTGFYIQAVAYDIDFQETSKDTEYRDYLTKLAEENSTLLFEMLNKLDPQSAEIIHINNTKRIIRALEYYKQTGKKISEHNLAEREKESPYKLLFYVLNMDRELLYRRIDTRVDIMFEQGLEKEVRGLLEMGYTKDMISMQGLGYKETIDAINGEYSFENCINIIKRDTRHFAKRQLTWFRREKNVIWLNLEEYQFKNENILLKIIKDIEEIRKM